jgi:type VI secretion system secreted protein VgrG
MEVVVTFLGGDVDRPLITGCVPNAINGPPFALPGNRTRSGIRTRTTPGGSGNNELSFEDALGREQIYLRAQRDLDEVIERNHTLLVRAEECLRVLGSRTDIVEGNAIARVGGVREDHVDGDCTSRVHGNRIDAVTGNSDERVSGTRTMRVEGRERHDVEHDAELAYAEDLTVRVRGCMTTLVGKHDKKRSWMTHAEGVAKLSSLDATEVSSEGEILLKVGKSSIRITADKIEIQSPAVAVKGSGGGLSASDDGLCLSSKGDVRLLSGERLLLKTRDGASLSMQKEVKVDGEKILLNSPEQAKDPPPKDPEPPTKVAFADHEGKPMAHERFVVVMEDGSQMGGMTDKDGKAEMELKSGGKVTFPDLSQARSG